MTVTGSRVTCSIPGCLKHVGEAAGPDRTYLLCSCQEQVWVLESVPTNVLPRPRGESTQKYKQLLTPFCPAELPGAKETVQSPGAPDVVRKTDTVDRAVLFAVTAGRYLRNSGMVKRSGLTGQSIHSPCPKCCVQKGSEAVLGHLQRELGSVSDVCRRDSTGRRVCEGGPCAEPEVQKGEMAGLRLWNKEAAGLRPETAFLSPNLGSFQDITVDSRVRQTQGARDIWGCVL